MKIQKVELTIPESIEDIRLSQFQEYAMLFETVDKDKTINEFVKMKTVSIFCNVPFELVRTHMKAKDVDELSAQVLTLVHKMSESIKESKFEPRFSVNDTEFGFINDFEDMNAGEYADLTEYFGKWDKMHNAMAIMYRPIKQSKYNPLLKIDQYELVEYNGTAEYAEIMKGMPAIKALQASFFLTNLVSKLEICLSTYLKKQQKVMKQNPEMDIVLKKLLSKGGAGIKPFTQLLTMIPSE